MYVIVGSVTTAARLKRLAERIIGIPVYVVHTPSAINRGGCSYSLRLDNRALGDIKAIAADNNITLKGIYTEKNEGGERVYYAVP